MPFRYEGRLLVIPLPTERREYIRLFELLILQA